MITKRIIPCLDVRDNQVVKGVQFKNNRIIGDILPLAQRYAEQGADELVFYDITASSDQRSVSARWINHVAEYLNIPFTVAGGIRTLSQAKEILNAGADKISINSPALENPNLINELENSLGSQCIVIGIDSLWLDNDYYVFQYTGNAQKCLNSRRKTIDWVREVQQRGAGEIVLNCMQADGVKRGFDLEQLTKIREITQVPLIASGGAGNESHFIELFQNVSVDGALAASVFHDQIVTIESVKTSLAQQNIEVRL